LKIPRVRWLPRTETLGADAAALLAETRVIAETLETFKEELQRLLARPTDRHRPPPDPVPDIGNGDGNAAATAVTNAMVLVIAAESDEPYLADIERALDQIGCGRDSFVSGETMPVPDTWRAELQDLLQLHNPAAVVFVDGQCSGAWADKRLRDLMMLLGDAAPRAERALCIFPPPIKPRRYRPPAGQVRKLDHTQLDRLYQLLVRK